MSKYKQDASKVVDGKVVVDWSQAPTDATHYTPETDAVIESFLKIKGNSVQFVVPGNKSWNSDWFTCPSELDDSDKFISR